MAAEVPEAILGAGTVLNAGQLDQARRAGARFLVSPGCTPALVEAAVASGLPFLPGVQTVSEAMALSERGFG
jgi:2-dehydro-3-deoxyphosphogluconate aldolase/(4S)-4-hydroxy-2-oxoglutarate aldolase